MLTGPLEITTLSFTTSVALLLTLFPQTPLTVTL
jgi:hypothetical protein